VRGCERLTASIVPSPFGAKGVTLLERKSLGNGAGAFLFVRLPLEIVANFSRATLPCYPASNPLDRYGEMKKLGWATVLALVVIACSTGADVVGEILDSGVPDAGAQPGDGYEVPCDETQVVEFNVYSSETVDGTEVRGDLLYNYKSTFYYSWTEVENVSEVVTYSCDQVAEWVPAQPTTPANPVRQEYVSNDPRPQADCTVIQHAQYTGNRVLAGCRTVQEYDHNEANPDNDPDEWNDNDRVYTSGAGRVVLAGTRVTE